MQHAVKFDSPHLRAERLRSPDALCRAFGCQDYVPAGGGYPGMPQAHCYYCGKLRITNLDLFTCTPEQLQAIHGIGPKTARFFILWTRPNEQYAALDVHVLRWLRAHGYPDAPVTTPGNPKVYATYEKIFLHEAKVRRKTARELDSEIWDAGSSAAANQNRAAIL